MISNQATMTKMRELRLHGMSSAFQTILETGMNSKFTNDELLAQLIDAEWEDRLHRKMQRLKKAAKFRYEASFEELDHSANRNLDKNLVLRLADCSWVRDHRDALITGPTGVGKSFLASAMGHRACEKGYKVHYQLTSRLMSSLKQSKKDGTYLKQLANVQKADVLILEDFGLGPFDSESRLALLDILEDRHQRKSTIFISQLPVASWYDLIGDSTIADAIMDRIVHGAIRIDLKGESMRKKMHSQH